MYVIRSKLVQFLPHQSNDIEEDHDYNIIYQLGDRIIFNFSKLFLFLGSFEKPFLVLSEVYTHDFTFCLASFIRFLCLSHTLNNFSSGIIS